MSSTPPMLPRTRVIQHLRQLIGEGALVRGDRLPPEEGFAASLGVSRSTLRAALAEAEEAGLIETRKHKGRFVKENANEGLHTTLIHKSIAVINIWDRDPTPVRRLGVELAVDAGTCDMLHELGIPTIKMRLREDNGVELARVLLRERPQGVVIDNSADVEDSALALLTRLREGGLPAVVQSNDLRFASFDRVASDHEQGSYELTQALLRRGRRRPLRMWEDRHADTAWQKARDRGHEKAMKEAGLQPLPAIRVEELMRKRDDTAASKVFDFRTRQVGGYLIQAMTSPEPPDAILASTDGQLFTLAAALRLFGRVPNEDVLLAGYDNYWWMCWEREFDDTKPALTVDKDNDKIGRTLVQLLVDRLAGSLPPEPQLRIVAPKLIVPDSGVQTQLAAE